jgi:hypothetical protein
MSAGSRRNRPKLSSPMNSASNSVQRVRLNQNDATVGAMKSSPKIATAGR